VEEESSKKPGRLLLTIVLLGIIGYSGYRVYPPLVDLWQRARQPVDAPAIPAKAESAPQSPNAENLSAKPEAQSVDTPQTSAPASVATAAPMENSAPQAAPTAFAVATATAKAAQPALGTPSGAEKTIAPQKLVPPPPPSPARLLESKLRAELAGQALSEKVKIQATANNALTLSGSLTFAEHRDLLSHLRAVPGDVRVIDDIEYSESQKAAPAAASAGWIWVRSTPPGARILLDGAETGQRTPARLELQAGQHEVRLVRRGFGSASRNVVVDQGQTMQFTQTLEIE
jgi:hypothetical protein